jgi:hypothetical protein
LIAFFSCPRNSGKYGVQQRLAQRHARSGTPQRPARLFIHAAAANTSGFGLAPELEPRNRGCTNFGVLSFTGCQRHEFSAGKQPHWQAQLGSLFGTHIHAF